MQDKFRCYHFGNFYFSGVHAGIQSHHSFMEIFNKFKNKQNSTQYYMLNKWAEENKTVIVLNGGMESNLEEFEMFMNKDENPFAWASFREGKEATNSSLTNIGVILPDYIFKMSSEIVKKHPLVLKEKGIGDGVSYDDNNTSIKVVDGGIVVSHTSSFKSHPLINSMIKEKPNEFSIKERLYSDFEVELMARMSFCRLM